MDGTRVTFNYATWDIDELVEWEKQLRNRVFNQSHLGGIKQSLQREWRAALLEVTRRKSHYSQFGLKQNA